VAGVYGSSEGSIVELDQIIENVSSRHSAMVGPAVCVTRVDGRVTALDEVRLIYHTGRIAFLDERVP